MSLIQSLRRLQRLDSEWDEKGARFQHLKQQLNDPSPLENQRQAQQARAQALTTARGTLRAAELELATVQEKLRENEASLYGGRVRAPKELDNLQKDGVLLRKHIGQLEDQILLGLTEVEPLEKATAEGARALAAFEAHWQEERVTFTAEYKALRSRLQLLQAERAPLRATLKQGELALYDELRASKSGMALTPYRDGHCQTCRVMVPSNKAYVEQGDAIALCSGCGRILYQG
jgi:hypothetical protein